MKNQALFSLKDKSKKLKCRLLQFLFLARLEEAPPPSPPPPRVSIGIGVGVGIRKIFKVFTLKFFYVMVKALSGELSCPCDRSCLSPSKNTQVY